MRNASGHQCKVKVSGSEKKVKENTYDISSIKRATKKFREVSRCSRAKQRKRNLQKKCAVRAKLLFFQLDLLLFFSVLWRCMPSPLSITRFYILFEQTISIIESFAFSPAKSIYSRIA